MNHRLIATVLGYTLCVEGFFLLLPAPVCVYFGEGDWRAFLAAAALCLLLGAALTGVPVKRRQLQGRDGYMAVALVWVVLSLFGALPYVWSGAIPNYIDALFETISGLTTTGATILNGVEQLGRGVLFWRSLTQWMGGMGVLVLFLALMPHLGGAVHLMRAESPGPIKSKLVPKVGQTAKILYGIYIGLTLLESVALRIAGMSWYDAVNHAFTTMATGGFSVRNTSIAAYNSPLITWIITVFMFLAGTTFSLLFLLLRGRLREVLHSGARAGDVLILTKPIGIGVLTSAMKADLCDEETVQLAMRLMTTLNKNARDVMVRYRVHACTDVTGFGLMGHLLEMCQGSGLAARVDTKGIDLIGAAMEFARMGVLPAGLYRNRSFAESSVDAGEVELAVQDLLFDPQTSGGLLMAADPGDAESLLADLRGCVPSAQRVGELTAYQGGARICLR